MLSILKAVPMIQVSRSEPANAEANRFNQVLMMIKKWLVLIISLSLSFSLQAQDEDSSTADDPAAPPPLPPKITSEQVEPTVQIRREEDQLVEEYSLNGRVYMVKISPDKGPAYYYFDEDGDGQLELQPGDEAMNPVRPVYWKVKEWK
jgi:hypothetical protein